MAYRAGLRLARARDFDVSHHLKISNYRFPSLLPFLGAPSVLGPLGGGEVSPPTLETVSPYSRIRRVSLAVGVIAMLIALLVGTLLGERLLLGLPVERFRRIVSAVIGRPDDPGPWAVSLLVVGYLLGALVAEFVINRPDDRGSGTALLVPRRLSDYLPAYVLVLQRGLPVVAVLGNHDWHANRTAELTAVLEDAGLVERHRRGKEVRYAVRPDRLDLAEHGFGKNAR